MAKESNKPLSVKRLGVDKANGRIVGISAGAAFLVVFFLVASWGLFTQLTYKNNVITAKKQAVAQLKKNLQARDSLVQSYEAFADAGQNFIGGNPAGEGPQDGTNPKLVLDALPSKYDFPALASSLEKVANDQKVAIQSVTGSDDAVAQAKKTDEHDPTPVAIPFGMKVASDYAGLQRQVGAWDKSIRPIQLQTLKITGDPKEVQMDITAQTFYQPEKSLSLRSKVVK